MNKRQHMLRPGPEVERSASFEAGFCDSLNCGLHIIPAREDGSIICEVVMSAEATLELMELCKRELYDKATRR